MKERRKLAEQKPKSRGNKSPETLKNKENNQNKGRKEAKKQRRKRRRKNGSEGGSEQGRKKKGNNVTWT